MTRMALRKQDGAIVCERCGVADRVPSRMRGLLGRSELGNDEGLLLKPAPSIQTFFMRFPIDAVFLDREGRVLKVQSEVRPWRFAACRGAHAALELPAGAANRRAIREGDRLEFAGGPSDVDY